MVDLIIIVVSLTISAAGTICVPVCTRNAHTDIVEHVVITDKRVYNLTEADFKHLKDMDSSK